MALGGGGIYFGKSYSIKVGLVTGHFEDIVALKMFMQNAQGVPKR